MTEWIVSDDARYLAWLVASPDGFVINSHRTPSAGYIILHRARCGTINRDLAPGRSWTEHYGKACSTSSQELAAWALERTGAPPASCGICGGDATGGMPNPVVAGASPRRLAATKVLHPAPPTFEGEPVRLELPRVDGGPALVIEGAQWLAEMFFRFDPSAIGSSSYDAWTGNTDRDRFGAEDIAALNRTMATHAKTDNWSVLFTQDTSPILADLPSAWDLITTPNDDPLAEMIVERVSDAIARMRGPYRQLATVTKLLHLKRPALVPVLDALVVDQVGGRGRPPRQLVEHLRRVGRSNLDALLDMQRHLATLVGWDEQPIKRPLLRILDAVLWSTHPASVLYPRLRAWTSAWQLPR